MPIKTHFVVKGLQRIRIDEYLDSELTRAGYGGVDIQKTPLGTRFTIYATRPGFVIGRRGKTVRELTETLKQKFGIDNPQIEVAEVEVPEFDAKIMARKLASSLERGFQYRRAVYSVLRRIMESGAKGVEITISGKLTSQRARYQKFRDGVITKCGEPKNEFVREATAPAFLKPGVMGVRVVIMIPGDLPDKIRVNYPEITPKVIQPEAAKTSETPVESASPSPEAQNKAGEQAQQEAKQPQETQQELKQPQEIQQKTATESSEKPVKEKKKRKPRKKKDK